MKLIGMAVENYKSYLEKQSIFVENGFNVFLGANNSGKTTMLEALDVDFSVNIPHRSAKNLRVFNAQPTGETTISIELELDAYEMHDTHNKFIHLALPENWRERITSFGNPVDGLVPTLMKNRKINLTYNFGGGQRSITTASIFGAQTTTNRSSAPCQMLKAEIRDGENLGFSSIQNYAGGINNELDFVVNRLTGKFYRFSAQRRASGRCTETSHPVTLASDAANLAYCLNVLQSMDSHGYQILCEWISRIFPNVHWVQSSPRPGGLFEVECMPLPPAFRRTDLAVPLDKMGSGIGNVIAMLYVVLTARFPRVIAIDEPNSFLHPKALRELLQIFAVEGRMHQYILTAHSADVLTAVPLSLVTMFEAADGVTTTQQVRGNELISIREKLSDLGIRMTDLHGRDRVLWVEGQTEELVFPELLRYFCPEVAPGTAVLRVEHTGTFEKKGVEPKEVAALYKRLTTSTSLVPPMVAILLDRENRKETECVRLSESSNGMLKFLEETMLENYVLHPQAICQALEENRENIDAEEIQHLLSKFSESSGVKIDGARILKSIFDECTNARTEFKKTRDVPVMVNWLLENEPDFLMPLAQFLRRLFGLS